MSKMHDWIGWLIARLGWAGSAGVALLLCAVVLQHRLLPEISARTAALRAEVATLAASRAPQTEQPQSLDALDDLADPSATPEAVGHLFKAASRVGLTLAQGEYRLQGGSHGPGLLRYHIVLPAQASYPVLRSFLADVLNANPGLALDGITLSRERVEQSELKAVLRFTLYLEAGKRL